MPGVVVVGIFALIPVRGKLFPLSQHDNGRIAAWYLLSTAPARPPVLPVVGTERHDTIHRERQISFTTTVLKVTGRKRNLKYFR